MTHLTQKLAVPLLLLLILLRPAAAMAQQSGNDLYKAKSALLSVMMNFELYQSSQGNSRYWDDLMLAAKQVSASIRALDEQNKLRNYWSIAAKHLNSASVSIKRGGYLEPAKQKQYHLAMLEVWHQLQIIATNSAIPPINQVQKLHLLIQQLTLRYLYERYQLHGNYQQWSLAEMAALADIELKKLNKAAPSDSLSKLLKQWNVLQRFFKDPDRAPVTFMVTRFAQDCSAELNRRLQ